MIHQLEWVAAANEPPIARGRRTAGERADDRDAERHPDLAAGRGDRGGDAGLRRRHPGDGRVGDRRVDEPEADPEHRVGGDQAPSTASSRVSCVSISALAIRPSAAGDERKAAAAVPDQASGQRRDHEHHQPPSAACTGRRETATALGRPGDRAC